MFKTPLKSARKENRALHECRLLSFQEAATQQSPSSSPLKRPSRHLKTEDNTDLVRSLSIRTFNNDKDTKFSDVISGPSNSHDILKTNRIIKVKKGKKELKIEEDKDTLKTMDEKKTEARPLGLKRLTREMQKEKDRRAFKTMGTQLKGSSIDLSVIPSDRREGFMKFLDERKEKKEEKKTTVEQKENTRIEEKIASRGHSNKFSIKDAPDWVKKIVAKNKKNDEDEKGARKWDHVFAPDHNFLDVDIVPDGVKRVRKGVN